MKHRMPGLRTTAAIGLFLAALVTARAQQYTFLSYGTREGLPHSQLRCLHQDAQGFIWIGSLGGLSRFDGRSFRNFDQQEGLPDNQVNCILSARDTLMAGSIGGVALVVSSRAHAVDLPAEYAGAVVNALFHDGARWWIGTDRGILFWCGGVFRAPDRLQNPWGANIKQIFRVSDGRIMVITKDAAFTVGSPESTVQVVYRPAAPDVGLFDAVEWPRAEGQPAFAIATKGRGVVRISAQQVQAQPATGLEVSTITALAAGVSGEVWMGSRFGFFRYDGSAVEPFAEAQGVPNTDIRDLLVDREGVLWLATNGGGLLRFTGTAFSSYTVKEGMSSNAVMSIVKDLNGDLWFSTHDRGICRLTQDTIINYDLREFSSNNRTWTSACDTAGVVWFGTSDGLYRYDGKRWQHFTEREGLSDNLVLSLYADTAGTLWIGTADGVCRMQGGVLSGLPGFPATRVRGITRDRAGHLWFATLDGLCRYDGAAVTLFTEADGLPDNSTQCVGTDRFNRLWVGTKNGLALFTGRTFQTLYPGPTAQDRSVNFLKYFDKALWVGTNNGLYRLKAGDGMNPEAPEFYHFSEEDGLRSLELNLNAVHDNGDGTLWFGTTEGVMRYNTALVPVHPRAPLLAYIENVQLDLQDRKWEEWSGALDASGLPLGLKVGHNENHFTFFYTAAPSLYPLKVIFEYRLIGFDQEWRHSAAQFATYSNLPHGRYTFEVRAYAQGQPPGPSRLFSFTIRTPFWLTWWFICLEALAVSGLVGFVLYWRKRILTTRYEKEKYELKSRLLALEQQSLNSSMNRHFIFNALNSIQYYINRQDKLAANKYLSDFARLIRKNLDSSQENLTTLREEIERLELYLKLEHMRFKDKFEYLIRVDEGVDIDTTLVPAMLLQPFLENSIWHGLLPKGIGGRVDVEIFRDNGSIHFIISDNGIGIDNALSKKSVSDQHISKGMEITSGRIELIKRMTDRHAELRGPYQMHDDRGQPAGTRVEIIIPSDFQQHFS